MDLVQWNCMQLYLCCSIESFFRDLLKVKQVQTGPFMAFPGLFFCTVGRHEGN